MFVALKSFHGSEYIREFVNASGNSNGNDDNGNGGTMEQRWRKGKKNTIRKMWRLRAVACAWLIPLCVCRCLLQLTNKFDAHCLTTRSRYKHKWNQARWCATLATSIPLLQMPENILTQCTRSTVYMCVCYVCAFLSTFSFVRSFFLLFLLSVKYHGF